MSGKQARARRRRSERTPAAEAAIRRAHLRLYELADDPTACMEQFAPPMLALVKLELRAEALLAFRELMHDPQARMEFVLMAYQSTLRLYDQGAFDEELEPA
ncbi:MAG TPA: hypothetical protein VGS80_11725 [Ktedonobacterales bacterium]|nr:hypothetical protein [Ktedonobacterales bacterium]